MNADIERALAAHGVRPVDSSLLLYHASPEADAIVRDGLLLPCPPDDVGERLLLRGKGHIYLSSSPGIGRELGKDAALLGVVLDQDLSAEIIRAGFGSPPRVELCVTLPLGEPLRLMDVRRMDAVSATALPEEVQDAIALFAQSPVGEQLADPAERGGRCWRASVRFISALREAGSDGQLRAWHGDGWEHGAVDVGGGIVIDWTESQMYAPALRPAIPYPSIRPCVLPDAAWGASHALDVDDPFFKGRLLPEDIHSWNEARERIPAD